LSLFGVELTTMETVLIAFAVVLWAWVSIYFTATSYLHAYSWRILEDWEPIWQESAWEKEGDCELEFELESSIIPWKWRLVSGEYSTEWRPFWDLTQEIDLVDENDALPSAETDN